MSKDNDKIKKFKDLKEKLKYLKSKSDNKEKNDVLDFYENSLKYNIFDNKKIADGMVIIITENDVIIEKAIGEISHKRVAQEIFDNLPVKHIDFSTVDGDFGHTISMEYGYIFIRMASILNGPTIVYYPEVCNEFQINKLEEFNNSVKQFNSSKKDLYRVKFEYNGRNDDDKNNLDELIEELKSNFKKTNTIVK